MKYKPEFHHRKSMRLEGYDYTQPGAYFITFCTYQRAKIFGEVINGEMKLSALGEIVREEWFRSAQIRKEIRLFDDEFMVMPNHGHGIIWIVDPVGADGVSPEGVCPDGVSPDGLRSDGVSPDSVRPDRPEDGRAHTMRPNAMRPNAMQPNATLRRAPRSLGSFMAGFKASVTSRAGRELNMTGIWQRNYYDHIIRNEREVDNIRCYILNNPLNWQLDRDNSQNIRKLSLPQMVEEYVKDVDEMVLKVHRAA